MKSWISLMIGLVIGAGSAVVHAAERSSSPEQASLYFITPAHGETVPGRFLVRFGLSGMGVAPAGVEREATGHHHLLINMDELPPADEPMPASEQLLHFGKGQTETWLELAPGTHSLQLVLGNHFHIMHKPIVKSKKITVHVPQPPAEEEEQKSGGLPGLFR